MEPRADVQGPPKSPGWYNVRPVRGGTARGAFTVHVYLGRLGGLVFLSSHTLDPERPVDDPEFAGWLWQGPFARESEALNAMSALPPTQGRPA